MRSSDTRLRILQASLACVERWGLARTSLEAVAQEAGLSRATVYRTFAGGRPQLVAETIAWEVGNFLDRLAEVLAAEEGLEAKLVRGLVFGHRAIDEHLLLQRILSTEPEEFLAEFQSTWPVMGGLVRARVAALLAEEDLRPGVEVAEAADYLARVFLSYLGSNGEWDMADEVAVTRLVRTQFMAGIVRPT